jgi:hypothetical protein
LARRFPRPAERAVRFLDKLLSDETQPRDIRMRCAELVLASYGFVSLAEERPRHGSLKAIVNARLDLSATDRTIAGQVRTRRKEQSQKLKEELAKI